MTKLLAGRGVAAAALVLGLSAAGALTTTPASAYECDNVATVDHEDGCTAYATPADFYESLKGTTEDDSVAYELHRGEGEREPRPEPEHVAPQVESEDPDIG